VIRNHRRAAHGESRGYEALAVNPVPLDYASVPQTNIIEHAKAAWTRRWSSASFTAIAMRRPPWGPDRHHRLVMDCDTTGIEPDFALVKFKNLRRRLLKIINRAVPEALRALGYRGKAISPRSRPMPSAMARSPTRPRSTSPL